uniref:Uncharacterized protein n=1 Tax=Anguilla anguilla TaxID=7936 RepID=A0A0E9TSR9_ANGAN
MFSGRYGYKIPGCSFYEKKNKIKEIKGLMT